jgi:hypothetical protein
MGWSHFERIDGRGVLGYLLRSSRVQHLCRLSSSLLFPWNFVHPTVKLRLQLQYGRRRGVHFHLVSSWSLWVKVCVERIKGLSC